jgi:chemotaxis signal transduction protein
MDLLVFRVARELFAAELAAVEEAIDLTAAQGVQRVPGSSSRARTIFTLRGVLVPLLSPAPALGLSPADAASALVIREGPGRVAIAVDDVEDVVTLEDGELKAVPAGDARDGGVLRGVFRRGSMLVAVVDLTALIAACRGAPQPEAA